MDELAAWLRRQAEEDRAAARRALNVRGEWYLAMQQAHACTDTVEIGPAYQHLVAHDPRTEIARAESVLAVLGAYETTWQAAEASWHQEDGNSSLRDQARGLRRAVRRLAWGYRYREGYLSAWGNGLGR